MKAVKLKGPVVTAVVAALAMAGVVGAFVSNASPYVTIAQAKTVGGDSLHLLGTLVKETCKLDFKTGHTFFKLKDSDGSVVETELLGAKPNTLEEADKIVAIGSLHDGRFIAHDLLTKCPTKYEEKSKDPLASLRS